MQHIYTHHQYASPIRIIYTHHLYASDRHAIPVMRVGTLARRLEQSMGGARGRGVAYAMHITPRKNLAKIPVVWYKGVNEALTSSGCTERKVTKRCLASQGWRG